MQCNTGPLERINSYALVSYIPGSLGKFLDELRMELVSSCVARSHVTVLPPRTLEIDESQAKLELERELADFAPFALSLANIQCFDSTSVIYLGVGIGTAELSQMHNRLNRNGLGFSEPHAYHPHVTLAHEFPPGELPQKLAFAQDRWKRFAAGRSYRVESLTFVQNTKQNRWEDLAEFPLGDAVMAGSSRR